jgi:RHS repeat-associated protein
MTVKTATRTCVVFIVAVLLSCLALTRTAAAQSYVDATGVPTFATTQPVELGFVDVSNGNLHLDVSIASAPQRGQKLKFSAKLVYDSRIWKIVDNGTSQVWQPVNVPNGQAGWRYHNGLGSGSVDYDAATLSCPGGPGTYQDYTNFVWTSAEGTTHRFPLETKSGCNADVSSADILADDASGYHMWVDSFTNAYVVDPSGVQVYPSYEDTNGNYFWDDGNGNAVDTLARTPVIRTVSGSQTYYDVLNSQGTRSRYTVNTGSISVNTAFGVSGVTEYSGSLTAITSIQLPNGTSYQFTYDSYGELASVTLPTGGQINYTHQNFTDSYGQTNRWIYSRSVAGGYFSYAPSVISSCSNGSQNCQQQVVVTKGTSDSVAYTFTLNGGAWNAEADYYNRDGRLLAMVFNDFDMSNPCDGCDGAAYVKVVRHTTKLTKPGGGTVNKKTEYVYDGTTTSNITAKKEWLFTTGSFASTPDRETDTTYVTDGGHTGYNIRNLPASVIIKNAAGTQVAQTVYSWDQYSQTGLSSVTGIVRHDDGSYGSSYTLRGNLTSVQQWVSGSTYLQQKFWWDTTGQPTSVADPKGNVTSFSYSDNFYNDNGSNPPASTAASGPTNAYVTTTTLPIIGAQTVGYYFGTGKQAFTTDQNGASAYAHYLDSLDRPTTAIRPDGGWSLTAYTSATVTDSYSSVNDTNPSSSCTSCAHNQVVLDSWGRMQQSSLVNDPDGQTYTNTSYDASGRVSSITNPFRSTTESTYGSTQTAFDGLDRLISTTKADGSIYQNLLGNALSSATQLCATGTYGVGYPSRIIDPTGKQRQYWTDGFGRLIEVDEPDSSNNLTVGTCYKYDVLNNLTQTVQQSQTRTYTYDALSRLTTVSIPESGTTTFAYQNGTAFCSGNPAAACSKTDARSVTTNYAYDALNRLLSRTYSDGTPTETFEYDQSSVWGIALANTKGRASHESTSNGQRLFSYDKAGRITDQWECLPSNCGVSNYHTAATYTLAGNVKQLTYPSGRTITYTTGTAGRTTQVALTAAGGQTLNYLYGSGIHYSPAGAAKNVTFGNSSTALTETNTFNNRLQLASSVTSSSVLTGMNHSLGMTDANGKNNGDVFSITDQLSSARTQTFAYDNLDRLQSATETAWGLSYAYDVYGNLLQQNVTLGSAPMLNVTVNGKNQISNSGFSYDPAGNLTADGTHTYQFDAAGRLKSLDATGATYSYDVNNLRLTKQVGSDTTEYVIFGSQTLAYHHSANWNDWTDLVYLNGKLLAKADSFEDSIHTHGTNCSACGSQYTIFTFANAGGYNGYVIRGGDKLFLRQKNSASVQAGMIVKFSDGTTTNWSATDQDGYALNADTSSSSWHYRRVDLSSYAGKTLTELDLVTDAGTAAGNWDVNYTDITLVSTDGTVRPIYNRTASVPLSISGSSGVTNRLYEVLHSSNVSQSPDETTVFYHNDHVGSSRMMSNANGYPTWQATYLPFGYEYNPQPTTNNYRFTGYERDTESGLDYANQRYLSSQLARFSSPDPMSGSLTNPQSLNKYTYALNNPLKFTDPTGAFAEPYDGGDDGGGGFFSAIGGFFSGVGSAIGDFVGQVADSVFGSSMDPGLDAGFTMYATVGSVSGGVLGGAAGVTADPTVVQGDAIYSSATGNLVGQAPGASYATDIVGGGAPFVAAGVGLGAIDFASTVAVAPDAAGPEVGTNLYRVWGGTSGPDGSYWSPTNPSTIPNYRSVAGLPEGNTGQFVSWGVLTDNTGVTTGSAATITPGQVGGLPEVFVPNPATQIHLCTVCTLDIPH